MKKLVLIAILLIAAITTAQKIEAYEITPDGWSSGFIVKECEGKTAKELYNNAILDLNKTYASPENVTKDDTNLFIRVTVYHKDVFKVQAATYASMRVTYGLEFKDGKIKIEALDIDIPIANGEYKYLFKGGTISYAFYNKKGKSRKRAEDDRAFFESYLAGVIDSFHKAACTTTAASSDW